MRPTIIAALTTLFAASCSSSPETQGQIDVEPPRDVEIVVSAPYSADEEGAEVQAAPSSDDLGPAPWTGAFSETAVMLAETIRIEGPRGLLEHVATRVDDAYYERTAETTDEGFQQTVVRMGGDVPEIRVRLDRWTMAATARVILLERFDDAPVTVTASGDAMWRDVDGGLARAGRLEFVGKIGQEDPIGPAGTIVHRASEPDGTAENTAETDEMFSSDQSEASESGASPDVDGTQGDEETSSADSSMGGGSGSEAQGTEAAGDPGQQG